MSVGLPSMGRGRPTEARRTAYAAELATFCERILEIRSRLDFAVSSRGWAYLLEGEGLIVKGDFAAAQRLINDCRKSGELPLDICATDESRKFENIESIDATCGHPAQVDGRRPEPANVANSR